MANRKKNLSSKSTVKILRGKRDRSRSVSFDHLSVHGDIQIVLPACQRSSERGPPLVVLPLAGTTGDSSGHNRRLDSRNANRPSGSSDRTPSLSPRSRKPSPGRSRSASSARRHVRKSRSRGRCAKFIAKRSVSPCSSHGPRSRPQSQSHFRRKRRVSEVGTRSDHTKKPDSGRESRASSSSTCHCQQSRSPRQSRSRSRLRSITRSPSRRNEKKGTSAVSLYAFTIEDLLRP